MTVYVFEADGANRIKIGYTDRSAEERLRDATMCPFPLKLIAELPGAGREVEQALHQRFAQQRVVNEWFELRGEVVGFVASVQAGNWPEIPVGADRPAPAASSAAQATKVHYAEMRQPMALLIGKENVAQLCGMSWPRWQALAETLGVPEIVADVSGRRRPERFYDAEEALCALREYKRERALAVAS